MEVREAAESDLPEILAIYNDVIATSTAVYRETPADIDERREWLRSRVAQGYPVVVAVDETGVTGFGSFPISMATKRSFLCASIPTYVVTCFTTGSYRCGSGAARR